MILKVGTEILVSYSDQHNSIILFQICLGMFILINWICFVCRYKNLSVNHNVQTSHIKVLWKAMKIFFFNVLSTLCVLSIFAYILTKYCFLLKEQSSWEVEAFEDGYPCWFTLHLNRQKSTLRRNKQANKENRDGID